MALRKDWTGSCVKPKYTTGGNINQTPKKGKSMTNKKGKNVEKKNVVTSDSSLVNDACTAMYQGWSVQGINRFNKLYNLVGTKCKGPLGNCIEDKFLQYCIENKEESKKSQKRKNYEYKPCCHDLWSIDPFTYII